MKKIENAVKALGLYDKKVFTMKELNQICEATRRPLNEVMWYLRHVKK